MQVQTPGARLNQKQPVLQCVAQPSKQNGSMVLLRWPKLQEWRNARLCDWQSVSLCSIYVWPDMYLSNGTAMPAGYQRQRETFQPYTDAFFQSLQPLWSRAPFLATAGVRHRRD